MLDPESLRLRPTRSPVLDNRPEKLPSPTLCPRLWPLKGGAGGARTGTMPSLGAATIGATSSSSITISIIPDAKAPPLCDRCAWGRGAGGGGGGMAKCWSSLSIGGAVANGGGGGGGTGSSWDRRLLPCTTSSMPRISPALAFLEYRVWLGSSGIGADMLRGIASFCGG